MTITVLIAVPVAGLVAVLAWVLCRAGARADQVADDAVSRYREHEGDDWILPRGQTAVQIMNGYRVRAGLEPFQEHTPERPQEPREGDETAQGYRDPYDVPLGLDDPD